MTSREAHKMGTIPSAGQVPASSQGAAQWITHKARAPAPKHPQP